jgi:DNA-binding response OmpR family regulator
VSLRLTAVVCHAPSSRIALIDRASPQGALLAPASPMMASSSLRVALAEDDGGLREAVAEALRDDGLEVLEAIDGSGLISVLSRSRVAAVVADLMMPGLRGDDVLWLSRASGDQTPFVVITAAPLPIIDSVARASCVTVLRKPFAVEALLAAVHAAIDAHPPPVAHGEDATPAEPANDDLPIAVDDGDSGPLRIW